MKRTAVRAYCSPTLVLLALDWADRDRDDFLGFAVSGFHPSQVRRHRCGDQIADDFYRVGEHERQRALSKRRASAHEITECPRLRGHLSR